MLYLKNPPKVPGITAIPMDGTRALPTLIIPGAGIVDNEELKYLTQAYLQKHGQNYKDAEYLLDQAEEKRRQQMRLKKWQGLVRAYLAHQISGVDFKKLRREIFRS